MGVVTVVCVSLPFIVPVVAWNPVTDDACPHACGHAFQISSFSANTMVTLYLVNGELPSNMAAVTIELPWYEKPL